MTETTVQYALPPQIKAETCSDLHAFLAQHQDQDVVLDCAAVTRIGGQAAQLIAAHVKSRDLTQAALLLRNPSEAMNHCLTTLGLFHLLDLKETC